MSITVGENESAKYWLGVLNDLKNQSIYHAPNEESGYERMQAVTKNRYFVIEKSNLQKKLHTPNFCQIYVKRVF